MWRKGRFFSHVTSESSARLHAAQSRLTVYAGLPCTNDLVLSDQLSKHRPAHQAESIDITSRHSMSGQCAASWVCSQRSHRALRTTGSSLTIVPEDGSGVIRHGGDRRCRAPVLQLGEGPQDLGQVAQAEGAQPPDDLCSSRAAEARRGLPELRKGPQRVRQALQHPHRAAASAGSAALYARHHQCSQTYASRALRRPTACLMSPATSHAASSSAAPRIRAPTAEMSVALAEMPHCLVSDWT